MTLPPRGWYPDPAVPGRERYWNGTTWTQVVRRAETVGQKAEVIEKHSDPALDVPLSGWWRRVLSGLIDYALVAVMTVALLAVVAQGWVGDFVKAYETYTRAFVEMMRTGTLSVGAASEAASELGQAISVLSLLFGGVILVYTAIFLGTWGATIGHRIVGIRVIRAPLPASVVPPGMTVDFRVEKPGWMRSISKGLAWALFSTGGSILIIAQIVNVFLPLGTKRKQSLTDLFANTLVIVGKVSESDDHRK